MSIYYDKQESNHKVSIRSGSYDKLLYAFHLLQTTNVFLNEIMWNIRIHFIEVLISFIRHWKILQCLHVYLPGLSAME